MQVWSRVIHSIGSLLCAAHLCERHVRLLMLLKLIGFFETADDPDSGRFFQAKVRRRGAVHEDANFVTYEQPQPTGEDSRSRP